MKIDVKFVEFGLQGVISIEVPGFKERVKILKELNIQAENGQAAESDPLEYSLKINELVRERVKSVKLKYKELSFESIDQLEYYKKGLEVINKLATIILNGVELGEE